MNPDPPAAGARLQLDVLFTPADFEALGSRDLSQTTCVVFDVLRATTSMVTALSEGAACVVPVSDIPDAMALRRLDPAVLLAGERGGLRIPASLTGTVDFDLGNSPREFLKERVEGRRIVMTTTNGTRALRACVGARLVVAGCLRNRGAVAAFVRGEGGDVLVVCSGTYDGMAFEDVLGAGALVDRIVELDPGYDVLDGAEIARLLFRQFQGDLAGAMAAHSRNGRRLARTPGLEADIAVCARLDDLGGVPRMDQQGQVRC